MMVNIHKREISNGVKTGMMGTTGCGGQLSHTGQYESEVTIHNPHVTLGTKKGFILTTYTPFFVHCTLHIYCTMYSIYMYIT